MRRYNNIGISPRKPTPVDMYKDGEYVMSFPSQKDAAWYLGAASGAGVWAVLNGRTRTYKGYSFRYGDGEAVKN